MLTNLKVITQGVPFCRHVASATVAIPKVKQKSPKAVSKTNPQYLITCKRSEFNLQVPAATGSKFGTIPLASKGWQHYKSKGDFFKIHPTVSEDQIRSEMQDVEEFLMSTGMHLDAQLLHNLRQELNIKKLTGIQVTGIPQIYDSRHALVAAETGCGKTLTYLLPIIQKIQELKQSSKDQNFKERSLNSPIAVIISPGRELTTQIGQVATQLCQSTSIEVKTILGGNTKKLMMNPEFGKIDVLVASMGALSKLVTTGIYRMDHVRFVVLDEADTLLDDTFSEKLGHFLKKFPFHLNPIQDDQTVGTQLILASATMPTNISERLKSIIDVETMHEIVSPHLHQLMPHVEQRFLRMAKSSRPAQLLSTVKTELAKQRPLLIFSNKSVTSDYVSIFLNNNGVNCLNFNGDMLMKIRLGRFEQFQRAECHVLSTTDVGSRGLDTTRARHVINFDFPLHVSDYIHRCGRIGRVNSLQKCLVTNFVSSLREIETVQRIEHAARTSGVLPNVNANIRGLINKRIITDMNAAGITPPKEMQSTLDEAF